MLSEIGIEQKFYEDFFGIRYDIRKKFNLDYLDSFPFMNPILILNPIGVTSEEVTKKLEVLGIKVECDRWIESALFKLSRTSTLKVVDWSDRPSKKTLGQNPKQIKSMIAGLSAEGRSFISLQEYLIVTGLVFATTGKFLEERFSTYFPELTCGNGASMARSDTRPLEHRLIITSGNSHIGCGARIAISIPLKY